MALFGQRDCGRDHLGERHRAVSFQRLVEPHHRARRADAEPGAGAAAFHDVAAFVLEDRRGRLERRLLAAIEEQILARGEVDRHEPARSEEHTSELQSLMRISYAVFCLTKNTNY